MSQVELFMPKSPTDVDLSEAVAITADAKMVTDSSGVNNVDKWNFVLATFSAQEISLFSRIDYRDVYRTDNPRLCIAASYMADMRCQYFDKKLAKNPDSLTDHIFYVRNRYWQARLRERNNLQRIVEATQTMRLT